MKRRAVAGVVVLLVLGVLAFLLWSLSGSVEAPRARDASAPDPPPVVHANERVQRRRDAAAPGDVPVDPAAKPERPPPQAGEPAEPKFPIEVTVLRSDGTPAPGASVVLIGPYHDGNATSSSQADAKGVVKLRAPADLVRVTAWLGAEAAATEELVSPKERGAVTVRLGPAVVVRGRVVMDGRPVAGANVSVTAYPWFASEFGLILSAKSADDGRFEAPPIAAAGVQRESPPTIDARTDDLATGHADADFEVVRRGGETLVELRPAFEVRVRFVDAEGRPVSDVAVHASPGSLSAESDEEGRVSLRLPNASGTRLVARWPTPSDSTFDAIGRFAGRSLGTVEPTKCVVDLGDIVLAKGRPLKGVVVDARGTAVPGALIDTILDGVRIGLARSDDAGAFEFPEVGSDAHRVAVRASGPTESSAWRTKIVDGVKGGDPDLRIVLDDPLAITLHFLSETDRKPLACAQYSVRVKVHAEGAEWYGTDLAGDEQETAVFEVLCEGTYDVEVKVAGFETLRFASVQVAAGRETSLDLLLRKKRD